MPEKSADIPNTDDYARKKKPSMRLTLEEAL